MIGELRDDVDLCVERVNRHLIYGCTPMGLLRPTAAQLASSTSHSMS